MDGSALRRRAVALAVSGGGDSIALMHLLARLGEEARDVPLRCADRRSWACATDSAAEARKVAALGEGAGLEAHVLSWTGRQAASRHRSRRRARRAIA